MAPRRLLRPIHRLLPMDRRPTYRRRLHRLQRQQDRHQVVFLVVLDLSLLLQVRIRYRRVIGKVLRAALPLASTLLMGLLRREH
jgi:hypothetical protein